MDRFLNKLRPASLRGFSFDTSSDSVTHARRIATHKYPGKDEPYHEDLGQDVRQFSIDAVIFGDDFIERADAFEKVLLQRGPSKLIHPHYGEIEVIVLSFSRRHSISAAGYIPFSITLEKHGAPLYPKAQTDTASELLNASEESYAALENDFSDHFVYEDVPEFITLDALSRIKLFTGALKGILNSADIPVFGASDLSNIPSKIQDIFETISEATRPPITPPLSLGNFNAPISVNPLQKIDALFKTVDLSVLADVSATTDNQAIRIHNAQDLDLLFQTSALASAVSTSRFAAYESREQALSYKKQFTDKIDILARRHADKGWDKSWQAVEGMNAAVTRDINERVGRLPYTLNIKPAAPRSSLALANRLYGDDLSTLEKRAQDIVARNKIRHPGFVPSEKLEVLIDA